MDLLYKLANDFWNVWLGLLFVILVVNTLWRSKRRDADMADAAQIPFTEDSHNSTTRNVKGA